MTCGVIFRRRVIAVLSMAALWKSGLRVRARRRTHACAYARTHATIVVAAACPIAALHDRQPAAIKGQTSIIIRLYELVQLSHRPSSFPPPVILYLSASFSLILVFLLFLSLTIARFSPPSRSDSLCTARTSTSATLHARRMMKISIPGTKIADQFNN